MVNAKTRLDLTTFSRLFPRNGRFEIGLWLSRTNGSRLLFFNNGVIIACLRPVGNIPENREASFAKQLETFLNNLVGSGLRAHVAEHNYCKFTSFV